VGFFQSVCATVLAVILLVLSGCSTVNRVVNMPFRAAENALSGTERLMTDPNVLPRTLDRGTKSPYFSPRMGGFLSSKTRYSDTPVSYNDFADDLLRPEPNLMIPLLP